MVVAAVRRGGDVCFKSFVLHAGLRDDVTSMWLLCGWLIRVDGARERRVDRVTVLVEGGLVREAFRSGLWTGDAVDGVRNAESAAGGRGRHRMHTDHLFLASLSAVLFTEHCIPNRPKIHRRRHV